MSVQPKRSSKAGAKSGSGTPHPSRAGLSRSSARGSRFQRSASVLPMKSKTVASNRPTSSQNRRTEKRTPMAAVVAW